MILGVCVPILVLWGAVCLAEDEVQPDVRVKEINMALENASSYPESIVLLPAEFPAEERVRLFDQLGIRLHFYDNELEEVGEDDVSPRLETVLEAASRVLSNTTLLPLSTNHNASSAPEIFTARPTQEEELVRKRRSLERLVPLTRVKRTYHHHHKGCMICQMLQPKLPIVINVVQPNQCGGGCYPAPAPAPAPVYHPPPPPPPPVYHPPKQQCNVCQPPPPPPPPKCDPCQQRQQQYSQPGYSQSYSSSSAQSSSYSSGWGKR